MPNRSEYESMPVRSVITDNDELIWRDPDGANNQMFKTSKATLNADLSSRFAPLASGASTWPETYVDSWHHAQADFSQTTQLLTNGLAQFRRHWFPAGYQITRLGVNVTVVGTTGAVVRLGVYDDVKGVPTNLIADGGTQVATATGYSPITVAITIPTSGYYHLVAVCQGAPATAPTIRVGRPVQSSKFPTAAFIIDSNNFSTFYKTGVTGALPNPLGGVAADSATNTYCIAFSGTNP